METYLIQIQVKKPNGKVHLISITREAHTPLGAYEIATRMSAGSGEIIGAYVTGDPYKVAQWQVSIDKDILRGYPNMKGN